MDPNREFYRAIYISLLAVITVFSAIAYVSTLKIPLQEVNAVSQVSEKPHLYFYAGTFNADNGRHGTFQGTASADYLISDNQKYDAFVEKARKDLEHRSGIQNMDITFTSLSKLD